MSQDDVVRQIAAIAFDLKVDPPHALARIRDVIAEGVIANRAGDTHYAGGETRESICCKDCGTQLPPAEVVRSLV